MKIELTTKEMLAHIKNMAKQLENNNDLSEKDKKDIKSCYKLLDMVFCDQYL